MKTENRRVDVVILLGIFVRKDEYHDNKLSIDLSTPFFSFTSLTDSLTPKECWPVCHKTRQTLTGRFDLNLLC